MSVDPCETVQSYQAGVAEMKFKTIVLLAVAIGCGLIAVLGVQQLTAHGDEDADTVKVLVATRDIIPGVLLDESNTTFKAWPRDQVPEGAVTDPEESADRALVVRAFPGDVLTVAKLGAKGVFGASAEIPTGMRVVSVAVNMNKTHSGMLGPGDRVDVLVTYSTRSKNRGMVKRTRTILEYVKVFAADNHRSGDLTSSEQREIKAKNISLLVTPDQANMLMYAQSKGELTLALRRTDDDSKSHAKVFDDSLFEKDDASRTAGINNKKKKSRKDKQRRDRKPAKKREDVRTFIAKVKTPPKKVVKKTERPKWKVLIYSGDQVSEQEFELPLPKQTKTKSKLTTTSAAGGQKRRGTWTDWLKVMVPLGI